MNFSFFENIDYNNALMNCFVIEIMHAPSGALAPSRSHALVSITKHIHLMHLLLIVYFQKKKNALNVSKTIKTKNLANNIQLNNYHNWFFILPFCKFFK